MADGHRAGLRSRHRRVRLRGVHLGQHADANGDHAPLDRHEARTVRLCRRDRGGVRHAAGLVCALTRDQSVTDVGGAVGIGMMRVRRPLTEPAAIRWTLVGAALIFLTLFLVVPLTAVFVQALANGFGPYFSAIREPDALAALRLTLVTAAIAVPANLVFGLCAGWAIARFQFPGRSLLTTLIDLPFAVSPVISGLVFVLLAGRQGLLGPWLAAH